MECKEDTKKYLDRIKKKKFKENKILVMPIQHKHETGKPRTGDQNSIRR